MLRVLKVVSEGRPQSDEGLVIGGIRYEYQLRVKEAFAGLAPDGPQDVAVLMFQGYKIGDTVLVDAYRNKKGMLELGICGSGGPVDSPYVAPMLAFLRGLKNGRPEASLSILVSDQQSPVDGAQVAISGPVRREAVTQKGKAQFEGLPPGTYKVLVSKPGYADAGKPESTREATLVSQSCASGSVSLEGQLEVAGVVKDSAGQPAPGVALRLWEHAPITKVQVLAAKSDSNRRFRFVKVKPGTFDLVTAGPGRQSYFPGRATQAEAAPIEVRRLALLENLEFTSLDSGLPRQIRIRVVDQTGNPVPEALIRDHPFDDQGRQQTRFFVNCR